MKVFLTGGTGFIGQPLTKALLARGWDVVALVRRPTSPQAALLTQLGARCVAGDVTDRESMRLGMAGADIVIHNAGWYEVGIRQQARTLMDAINVGGTDNVLGLAHELGVPRVVHVSSIVYYGATGEAVRDETYQRQKPPLTYYEASKIAAHEVAQRYYQRGLPVICVCPATVIGPNDHSPWGHFLRLYMSYCMPPLAWSPDSRITSVHVDDVAAGIALAAAQGVAGENYLLAGDPMSIRQLVELWATTPGGFRVRFFLPTWLAKLLFAPCAPLLRAAGLSAFISAEAVLAASESLAFSSVKAQRELGWTYRPTEQAWYETIEGERQLLARRPKRDLVARLKPLEIVPDA